MTTISLEYLFNSLIIDTHKGRNVENFDVPAAYLNADMLEGKFIFINIEGKFVEIMCELNPKHKKNVRVENGVKVLYLKLLKIIYRFMDFCSTMV